MFSNYMAEAKSIDNAMPSMFVVTDHWADTARAYLANNTPKSRVESFGGHMMFWEHHEKFNTILDNFMKSIKN